MTAYYLGALMLTLVSGSLLVADAVWRWRVSLHNEVLASWEVEILAPNPHITHWRGVYYWTERKWLR